MPATETIKASTGIITAAGENSRTLIIAGVLSMFVFIVGILWMTTSTLQEQRDDFLQAMEKRDEGFQNSINKLSDAITEMARK